MTFIREFRQVPLIRLLIPFILGIILQINISFHQRFLIYFLLFLLILIFIEQITERGKINYNSRWIYGLLIHVFLFLTGIELVWIKSPKSTSVVNQGEQYYIANIIQSPDEKDKTYGVTGKVFTNFNLDFRSKKSEKVLMYFEKDSLSAKLEHGDQLILKSELNLIQNQNNPYEFDYKAYNAYRGIHKQTFIKSGNWKVIKRDQGNILLLYAAKLREYLIKLYKKNGLKGDEFAVVSALTLGYKKDLSEELKKSYSVSGVMHILAVSGLHVGIIYLVLSFLLAFIKGSKYFIVIKALLIILLLLAFAFVTGLSPSVKRATIMFIFIIIGKSINRKINIYNILGTSAFFLLLLNPFIIMEVGFQLSYMAVISIVYFQPKIYQLLNFKNWLTDKIWILITVSLAAQIGTFPLIFFYFHQFPNYFIITNILVIPFAAIIIYLGILVLIFSGIPIISFFLTRILEFIVKILNIIVAFIENTPNSLTEGIFINRIETFIFYLLIISLSVLFVYKIKKYFLYCLVFISLLLIFNFFRKYESVHLKRFIIYNITNTTAYDFIEGKRNIIISEFSSQKSENQVEYYAGNNLIRLGITETTKIKSDSILLLGDLMEEFNISVFELFEQNYIVNFHGRIFLFLQYNILFNYIANNKLEVDYLILTKDFRTPVKEIVKYINPKKIIIDTSIPLWKRKIWIKECSTVNISCYSVPDQGAFQVDL